MSVIRIKKTENYVVLAKECLENPNLSFKAKGLWAYCMGRPNDWEFKIIHLIKVSKDGEDAIYSAIKELEQEGYCKKMQPNKNGKFQSVDYEMYEVSILKKCLPQPDFPDAGNPRAGNPALLSNDKTNSSSSKEDSDNDLYQEPAAPVSAEASALADLFLQKIKEKKPDFKPKAFQKWAIQFEYMMRLDKRSADAIKRVISHVTSDVANLVYVQSAKKLREDFDRIEMKLEASSVKDLVRKNREYALALKNKYPEQMKRMRFDEKFVSNPEAGKEVPFNIHQETFKEALISMFGGTYDRRS